MKHFDADKPIQASNQDLLGRSGFAEAIAKAIIDQKGDASHVIGLYGQWGSGKTSTLNMVAEAIAQTGGGKNDTPYVIMFSSWGSDSIAQLLSRFCSALQNASHLGKAEKNVKKLTKLLSEYSDLLTDLSPKIGFMANVVGKISGKSKSAAEIKSEIGDTLKKQKRKIVVIIDDIDRLPDEQVRHVFQFVNSVVDFPNVIYILPFDYSVVASALSGVQGADGEAYMHKVIQVPLTLPDPQPGCLLEFLSDEVDTLIDQSRDDFSQERLWQVTTSLIMPQMNTMRDMRRLQNVFRFQTHILGKNLNSIDILGLSALIAFDPLLYDWIKSNKHLLLSPRYGEKSDERREAIARSLLLFGYSKNDVEQTQKKLLCLFPSIRASSNIDRRTAWKERRVCHEDIFELYFASKVVDSLPQRSVSDALYRGDICFLGQAADLAISAGTFGGYLEELDSRLSKVAENFVAELALMLLSKLGADPILFAEHGLFTLSFNSRIGFMVRELLSAAGKEKSYEVFYEAIDRMNIEALAAFASELNYEELAHGRLAADSIEPDKQCLTPAGLDAIENKFLERVRALSQKSEFASSNNLAMLVYLWLCYDEIGCKSYWERAFDENPLVICHFIATNAGRWSSSGGQFGWSFSKDIMEPILPRERALKKIEELRATNVLVDLDEDTLLKTIIYTLDGYNDLRAKQTSATEAHKMISSWVC